MADGSIVVIGAGMVGVSTAIHLQREGFDVLLIDREGPAAGASYGNGGVVVPSGIIPINAPGLIKNAPGMLLRASSPLFLRWSYLPRMLPWLLAYLSRANRTDATRVAGLLRGLLEDAVEQHRQLAAGTGAEQWIEDTDYVFVYPGREAFDKDAFGWNTRRDLGIDWQILEGEAWREYDADFADAGEFAVRMPGHARITDPGRYVCDLAAHFERQGGRIERASATGFKLEASRLKAVETDQGNLECDKAVVCCGVWSKALVESLGVRVSMEAERGYHIDLINPSKTPRSVYMLTAGKFVITPMAGRLRCAGIVEFGGIEAGASAAPVRLLKQLIGEACPQLEYDNVEEWVGCRPAPSDSIPSIGPLPGAPDVYAAYGHHHVGLTAGPKTGRMIADCIAGRDPGLALAPMDPARFSR